MRAGDDRNLVVASEFDLGFQEPEPAVVFVIDVLEPEPGSGSDFESVGVSGLETAVVTAVGEEAVA